MAEKSILIVDADLIKKIDESRGDMSRAEFLHFLFDSLLKENAETRSEENYVSYEEFNQFTQGMKELLRNFLEFFLSYGMELGDQPKDKAFTELTQKLQSFGTSVGKSKKA